MLLTTALVYNTKIIIQDSNSKIVYIVGTKTWAWLFSPLAKSLIDFCEQQHLVTIWQNQIYRQKKMDDNWKVGF